MHFRGKFHGLLASSRVANLPSVLSNVSLGVWMGVCLSAGMGEKFHSGVGTVEIPWLAAGILVLAGMALYMAGNFFNDWMDRDWDAKHRPERALPRGLFRPEVYGIVATVLAAGGWLLAAWVNGLAAGVAACILVNIGIYTLWHKKTAWAVIPMGLCRALLPPLGLLGVLGNRAMDEEFREILLWSGGVSCALFFYIVCLSLAARGEAVRSAGNRVDPATRFARCGFLLPIGVVLVMCVGLSRFHPSAMLGIVPYLLWMGMCEWLRLRRSGKYVSCLLAGIPWVDAIFLMFFLGLAGLPLATVAGLGGGLPLLAVTLALSLQRFAPAT